MWKIYHKKKIITDNINKMYEEVENKISERQKLLDHKLKDIEDTIKGKKK